MVLPKNILSDDGYFGETWIEREKIELYERLLENGYEKRCTKCGELKTAKGGFDKSFRRTTALIFGVSIVSLRKIGNGLRRIMTGKAI